MENKEYIIPPPFTAEWMRMILKDKEWEGVSGPSFMILQQRYPNDHLTKEEAQKEFMDEVHKFFENAFLVDKIYDCDNEQFVLMKYKVCYDEENGGVFKKLIEAIKL